MTSPKAFMEDLLLVTSTRRPHQRKDMLGTLKVLPKDGGLDWTRESSETR